MAVTDAQVAELRRLMAVYLPAAAVTQLAGDIERSKAGREHALLGEAFGRVRLGGAGGNDYRPGAKE